MPLYENITQKIEPNSIFSVSSNQFVENNLNVHGNILDLQKPQERGDPDGDCGIDKISINCMTRNSEYNSSLDDMMKFKKGWLYKKTLSGIWHKHWFRQNGAALFYYRDAIAEERGILDGVLDLNNVTDLIIRNDSQNKFGFTIITWDNKTIDLAALTDSARSNWLSIIKQVTDKNESVQKQVICAAENLSPTISTENDIYKENNVATLENDNNLYKLDQNSKLKNDGKNFGKPHNTKNTKHFYISTDYSENQLRRMGSISDIADLPDINPYKIDKCILIKEYEELKYRFKKIIEELRIIKKELKAAYNMYDTLEIDHDSLKREMERYRSEEQARVSMMAERIEDLTIKYTSAEKNARNWRMKFSRAERRKSISLKGKEYLSKDSDVYTGENATQLIEMELNHKLNALLYNRRLLQEKNELSPLKKKELLLQRLSYESVCFEHLKTIMQIKKVSVFKDFSFLHDIEVKIAELQRKTNNDISSYVPTKLPLFDMTYLILQDKNHSNFLERLLILQKDLITTVEKYKKHKIEGLLNSLIIGNKNTREDVLQNVINEITNFAFQKTNEDLIKYEVHHLMALLSKSNENMIFSPLPLTMLSTDMYYFEILVDQIHESLKHELSVWILELNNCFDKISTKIKSSQCCLQLEQERKTTEKECLISNFSNLILLKSVIDGQVLFITKDHSSELPNINNKDAFFIFLEELKDQYLISEKSFSKFYQIDDEDWLQNETSHENQSKNNTLIKNNQIVMSGHKDDTSLSTSTEKTLQKRYREEIEQLRVCIFFFFINIAFTNQSCVLLLT